MPKTNEISDNLRLGLCCIFAKQQIKFRTTTATHLIQLNPVERKEKLATLCRSNAQALLAALMFCRVSGIGCFRIGSSILPCKTHPQVGYEIGDLPDADSIVALFQKCGSFSRKYAIRTVFHPDQFVVLNSPHEHVVHGAIKELEYQAEVAHWVAADVINIHAGGAYGDKTSALARLEKNIDLLSDAVRSRLTLENDDKVYSPSDLLPHCRSERLPLVYDVHHHRCHPDGLSVEVATAKAIETWDREPLFHISSPRDGWDGPKPQRHHDYIDMADFPNCWRDLSITVEVEAKAKELAVLRLQESLRNLEAAPSG